MPKKKTHKGARHRVRVTRNGKVIRFQAGKRKLMSGKSGSRRRNLSRQVTQQGEQAVNIRHLLSS
jgi:ribosomal protein L35